MISFLNSFFFFFILEKESHLKKKKRRKGEQKKKKEKSTGYERSADTENYYAQKQERDVYSHTTTH